MTGLLVMPHERTMRRLRDIANHGDGPDVNYVLDFDKKLTEFYDRKEIEESERKPMIVQGL